MTSRVSNCIRSNCFRWPEKESYRDHGDFIPKAQNLFLPIFWEWAQFFLWLPVCQIEWKLWVFPWQGLGYRWHGAMSKEAGCYFNSAWGEITAGNRGLQFRMVCPVSPWVQMHTRLQRSRKFCSQALSSKHEEGSWGHHLNSDPLMYIDSMGIFKHENLKCKEYASSTVLQCIATCSFWYWCLIPWELITPWGREVDAPQADWEINILKGPVTCLKSGEDVTEPSLTN